MNELWKAEIEELERVFGVEEGEGEAEGGAETPPSDRFRIRDISALNWALRKLAALDRQEAEINELARQEVERIEEWRKKRLESVARSREYLTFLIEEYAREQRALDPKWKASTPYGRVSFRRQQPKWHWKDDQVLVDWLERAGYTDMVRVKKEPEKAVLKKRFSLADDGRVIDPETGEVVPGVVVEEQGEKLVVEVE